MKQRDRMRRGCGHALSGRRRSDQRDRQSAAFKPSEALESRLLFSTFTVTSTADVASTAPNFVGTLRWAVAQADAAGAPAADPSVIDFDPSLFGASGTTPQTITLTKGQLLLSGGASTIKGPGAGLLTVNANHASTVFFVSTAGNAALSGLTLTGGAAVNGFAGSGAVNGGTLSLTACVVSGNAATFGAGVQNLPGASGSMTLTACTISGNTAASTGGGGGIYNQGKLTIVDCTIANNSGGTTGNGGGIYDDGNSTLTVSDSTISGNSAGTGSGIYNVSPATLNNTIVAANTSASGGDLTTFVGGTFNGAFAGSFNLIGDGTGESGLANNVNGNQVGTAASPVNPKLGALQNNGGLTPTMALLAGSPAFDAGSINLLPSGLRTDQRGYIRTANASVDIGAYEFDAAPVSLEGPTLVVTTTGDGDFVPGNLTLRQAMSLAGDEAAPASKPTTITFSPLTFGAPQTITLTQGHLVLFNGSATIAGPGTSLLSVSGNNSSGVFSIGLNISVAISGMKVINGSAAIGGGLFNAGTTTVTACTFTGGSASFGGGVANSSFGTLALNACTLSGNSARAGGGGAGLYNQGKLTVTDCTIANNNTDATNGVGGGIYNDASSTLTVSDTTISGNSAPTGGGIYNVAPTTLNNTIVAGNSPATKGDLFTETAGSFSGPFSGSHNLIGNGTGETGLTNGSSGNQVGTTASPVNPKLGPLQNNGGPTQTMALLSGSPAIDAGSNALLPAVLPSDQRGSIRIANVTVDIGAYEFGAAPVSLEASPIVVTSAADGTDYTPGTLTLRQAISLADAAAAPAASPSIITFSPALIAANPPPTITLSQGLLDLTAGATTLTGPGAALLTVSGNNAFEVFSVASGVTAAISGVKISGGSATGGGGVRNAGTLSLSACTLSGNTAVAGGGVDNLASATLTITASTFSNNSAHAGTGVGGGGAAAFNAGTLTVINCTFNGNTAALGNDGGGGINNAGVLTVSDSTLSGNSAPRGGGIYSTTPVTLNNTLVAGNTNLVGSSSPDLFTATGNSTTGAYSGDNNLIGNGTGETGLTNGQSGNQVGTTSAPVNPKLGPLQDNGGPTPTMALLAGSPAINAGLLIAGVTTDQRGVPRPQGPNPDIGAFEQQATINSMSYEFLTRQAVTFNFAQDASLIFGRSNYTLTNLTTNQTLPSSTGTFSFNGPGTQATLVLTNFLPDGNYRLTSSSTATPLDFFVFTGDANHDRSVGFQDLVTVAQNYNTSGRTFSQGDFNYDGMVDFTDLVMVAQRYNTSLAPPPAAAAAVLAIRNVFSVVPVARPVTHPGGNYLYGRRSPAC